MAKYNIDSLPQMIELGRQGENKVRAITIDCGEMLARWGGAEIVLRAVRPGEETPYIVDTSMDSEGVMTWEPDTTDTAYAGTGRAELRCTVDGIIEKSAMFATCITAALSDVDGDKADAPSSWTQAVLDAADRVTGIGATAVTLDAGADATVTSDGKTLTFGIPRGAQGAQGIQGERGLQGVQGERGLQGEKGEKGDTGAQGIQGVQGEKGADGVSPKVTVTQSDDGTVISVTDAEGTTTATVKGGGESVQADWAQNDSTAKDYIKNRVGGYGAERSYTWDGTVADDMTNIGGMFYYAESIGVGGSTSDVNAAAIAASGAYTQVVNGVAKTTEATLTATDSADTGVVMITAATDGMPVAAILYSNVAYAGYPLGLYLLRDYTDASNYQYTSKCVIECIARIPAKYIETTNAVTKNDTTPITSGGVYTTLNEALDDVKITNSAGTQVKTAGTNLTVSTAGVMSVNTTDTATSGSTTPITSGGVYTLLGDVETLLKGV